MKNILFALLMTILVSGLSAQRNEQTAPAGSYLGMNPPGNTPVFFAPGIISHPDYFEHSSAVFSPDGKEVYWAALRNGDSRFKIYFMQMVDGKWTEKQKAPFCIDGTDNDTPVFSLDGKKIFFTAGEDIWVAERKDKSWGKAEKISGRVNSSEYEQIGSLTNNGSIYFMRIPGFEIFVSKFVNGNYTDPVKLDKTVNFDGYRKMAVYTAPDENYMIVEASKDPATCGLFVFFKKKDNTWTNRALLPVGWARFPYVSPDGKYLFFMTREGVYWVSAKIIEALRPKGL